MTNYVLHHADADGRFAGYIAQKTLKNLGLEVQTFEVQYGEEFPLDIDAIKSNVFVYIVDFSYAREVMDKIYEKTKGLVVLDHHKTAKDACKGAPYAVFDLTKSGALLAWEYFMGEDEEPPLLCKVVNDRDLWKFEVPETNAVSAYLNAKLDTPDWEKWDELCNSKEKMAEAIQVGEMLIELKEKYISKFINGNSYNVTTFEGWKCVVVNSGEYISDLSAALIKHREADMSVCWFMVTGKIVFSLRASATSSADVSVIAKKFGGGGHPKASGFSLPIQEGFDLLKSLY